MSKNILQVKAFIALDPKELADEINKFLTENKVIVRNIDYITPLAPDTHGAYLTYHILE